MRKFIQRVTPIQWIVGLVFIGGIVAWSASGKGGLTGWGPFKFGMTIKEAVSAAQAKAGANAAFAPAGFVTYDTKINDDNFRVSAYFSGATPRLFRVQLDPMDQKGQNQDLQSCAAFVESLAAKLASTYGLPGKLSNKLPLESNEEAHTTTSFEFGNGTAVYIDTRFVKNEYTTSGHMCIPVVIYASREDEIPNSHL
jgi:hypothetical protein